MNCGNFESCAKALARALFQSEANSVKPVWQELIGGSWNFWLVSCDAQDDCALETVCKHVDMFYHSLLFN